MNSIHHGWSLDEIAPEARRAAERAADAAGMPLEVWLNQLIKYVSAMELSGKGPARARAIDETIKRAAAEQARIGSVEGFAGDGADAPMMLEAEAPAEQPTTVAAEVLEPNRFAEEQPGERDIEQAIGEWRKSGALKPLVVRPDSRRPGHYEIVSGMERWHAASRLHMRRIPVTVQQLSDEEVLRATLIQKLHTKSLPPLDEAQIYQRLMEETGLSVAALSDVIGRSPTHVATALQLLDLPEPVREMINSGELSVLHARTLLGAVNPEPAAREVVARRLDIYQTEQLVRASHGARTPPAAKAGQNAPPPAAAETTEAPAAPETPVARPETPAATAPADAPGRNGPDTPGRNGTDAPGRNGTDAPGRNGPDTPESLTLTRPAGPTGDAATGPPEEAPRPGAEPVTLDSAAPVAEPPAAAPLSTVDAPAAGETDHGEAPVNIAGEGEAGDGETGDGEAGDDAAPLDMAAFITADTAAPSQEPGAVETAAPMVLGAGNGDAGTLIEASPAIDSPVMVGAPDDSIAFEGASRDGPANHDAADADAVAKTDGAADADSAAGTGLEPANAKPTGGLPAADEPLAIPAAATLSEDQPAARTGPVGNGGDHRAHSGPGNSGDGGVPDREKITEVPREAGGDDSTRMVETHLSTLLGLKVSIAERNQDDGVLSIHYNSESELTDLVSRLNRMPTGRRAE